MNDERRLTRWIFMTVTALDRVALLDGVFCPGSKYHENTVYQSRGNEEQLRQGETVGLLRLIKHTRP